MSTLIIQEISVSSPRRATVGEVMSGCPVTVRPELPVTALAELLVDEGLSGVPVVDGLGRLLGVVSKTDLVEGGVDGGIAALRARHARGLSTRSGETVEDLMTEEPVAVSSSITLAEAAALMTSLKVHRLPVTDDAGRVVGIISASDLVRWLAELP